MKKYLTFSDVSLLPNYSEILPSETKLQTKLTKKIILNMPLISAAMDTVTEAKMAIMMALNGGIGIIHKNMTITEQVAQLAKVKTYREIFTYQVYTINQNEKIAKAMLLMENKMISSCVVVDDDNKLQGILTSQDLKFIADSQVVIKKAMNRNVVYLKEDVTFENAYKKIYEAKLSKLPVVNDQHQVVGLVTLKKLNNIDKFTNKVVDKNKKLLVGAAVSVNEHSFERIEKLIKAQADVIVIDSAHGHSAGVINLVKQVKTKWPNQQVIAGNIVTTDGARALCQAGADAIKVGIGSGSICTTRIVAGVGAPQLSALLAIKEVAQSFKVPMISDGGINYAGDIVKALAAGASTVMLGSLFAGHDESPGDIIEINGKKYKSYVGMGSIAGMKRGGNDRYFQAKVKKFVPEGVEALKPYKGNIDATIYQLVGSIRAGLGYNGSANIGQLQNKARFIEISSGGEKEAHPHALSQMEKAPNYG